MLLSAPCYTDTWVYLNQSLLISLITTFGGRACEFQQFHSIFTLIIINTLNTVTAIGIMMKAYFVDEYIKFNVLKLREVYVLAKRDNKLIYLDHKFRISLKRFRDEI